MIVETEKQRKALQAAAEIGKHEGVWWKGRTFTGVVTSLHEAIGSPGSAVVR